MNVKHHKKKQKETGNLATIRGLNRNAVLNNIRACGATSRVELVKALKLAPATITAVVGELLEEGLVIEGEYEAENNNKRNRGRPSKRLCLNADAAFSLGLSLRVEHDVLQVDTSISDYANHIRFGPSLTCTDLASFKQVVKTVINAVDSLLKLLPANANIIGLGVGIPGVVTQEDIQFSPNVSCIEGTALYESLTSYVSFPVCFENDVNLLAVRELDTRPDLVTTNFSYLFVSQGVGAGIALYGELWRSSGWSGEIGHLQFPFEGGAPRSLEWLIGLDGYFAEQMAGQNIIFDEVDSIPDDVLEKPGVKNILESYSSYLFLAVQVLNCSFDLDVVIIGTSHESILDHCMPRLTEMIQGSPLKVKIVYSTKGQNAAVEGAALLALNQFLPAIHEGGKR